MTAEPEIREITAQPTAIERASTDRAGLAATIDSAFPRLFGGLAAAGVAPAGPPYIRYHEAGERFEIELGVPLPEDAGELESLERASLPAGRAAVLRHAGPYEGLAEAHERLSTWIEALGEQAAGPHWEVYVTDPRSEPDPSKRITEIYVPLA